MELTRPLLRDVLVLTVAAAFAAACGQRNTYAPPPPPQVVVAHPVARDVTTYLEYTGHTASVEAVEIRARVEGVLESMHFTPGTNVKKGDLLFVIEPELYEARVAQAEANLENARTTLRAAEQQLAITNAIFERKAGSKTDLLEKQQARDQAVAELARAEANLTAARLDLSYTHIYAPIDGRIDRNFVDVGNLVGADKPTLLASIVRLDPIYAYFDAPERDVLDYRELDHQRENATPGEERRVEAHMALANEAGYPHAGRVDYMSNTINPSTGTFEVRAVFPNSDAVLLPGLFVRVRVPFARGVQTVVPEEAVGADQGGRFLLVVDEKNTVQRKPIEIGPLTDGMRIVRSGATTEDVVIVNGLQRVRPGVVVDAVRAEDAAGGDARPAPSAGKPSAS